MTKLIGRILAVSAFLAAAPTALAQQSTYTPPKNSWGVPDLDGAWVSASVTQLERKEGYKNLVLTPEEAAAIEGADYHNMRANKEITEPKIDLSTGLPEKGGVLPIGNYSPAYIDAGSKVGVVRGELRSSWIIDPSNGKIPYSEAGLKKLEAWRPIAFRDSGYTVPAGGKPLSDKPGPFSAGYDGPESRGVSERCIIGLGGAGGPVMNSVLYNSHHQIVQSPGFVMINVEMNHDARIIPIVANEGEADKRFLPVVMAKWLGDSVGWYEGGSLVVKTRNVNRQQGRPVFLSDTGVLIERFTRVSDDEYLYEFTVNDPEVYTQPWKGEMPVRRKAEPLYEYACHEGNYGLYNILSGARENERTGKALAETSGEEN